MGVRAHDPGPGGLVNRDAVPELYLHGLAAAAEALQRPVDRGYPYAGAEAQGQAVGLRGAHVTSGRGERPGHRGAPAAAALTAGAGAGTFFSSGHIDNNYHYSTIPEACQAAARTCGTGAAKFI